MRAVGSKPERELTSHKTLLGSVGNDLSMIDIGISDTELKLMSISELFRYRKKRI
jgi:hypothetical protein